MSVEPPSERTDVETASSIARLLRGRGRETEDSRDTEDSLDERLALASMRRALGSEIAPVRLGRFAVTRRLGRGGQGCVYEATDEILDRRVALEIPRFCHDGAHDDLTFEAQAIAGVRHPNLVTIFALEWCEGRPVLVMELVGGTPLLAWVATARPRLARVLDVITRVGDGLGALHAAGLACDRMPSCCNAWDESCASIAVANGCIEDGCSTLDGQQQWQCLCSTTDVSCPDNPFSSQIIFGTDACGLTQPAAMAIVVDACEQGNGECMIGAGSCECTCEISGDACGPAVGE